jgi:putative nucleotidyltransferase with HDIG domain
VSLGARWSQALGALRGDGARRALALVAMSLFSALLVMDVAPSAGADVEVGQVAPADVRAGRGFDFVDWEETRARQRAAEDAVLPVFDHDATLGARLGDRITDAFAAAAAVAAAEQQALPPGAALGPEARARVDAAALERLDVVLDPADLAGISALGWSPAVAERARRAVVASMAAWVVADRSVLPPVGKAITVLSLGPEGARDERRVEHLDQVHTPAEARQQVSLSALEAGDADSPEALAAVAVARAMVRPNFSVNQLLTEDRRREARDSVLPVRVEVGRGTVLARAGDVLSRAQVDRIRALRAVAGTGVYASAVAALAGLVALLAVTFYVFASSTIKKFSTRPRDLEALAVLLVLGLGAARLVVEVSVPLGAALGLAPATLWLLLPFAGFAMLARVLINSETAFVYTAAAAVLLGVLMDQQVLYVLFFAVSAVVGCAAVGHSSERAALLRAGLLAGLVNAGAALLLFLVEAHLAGAAGAGAASNPLWGVAFGFLGGLLSGVVVLGLVPLFELVGFVTDYKLLELANLNHPLLRQLMLRAPGTYHHSVTVAQLCEAAAEAIGANALQTRVACYFHDIGKAVNPRYFVENQRGGPNPHDRLPPRTSARVIINHVLDGEAIARQYRLPQPIIDGIVQHHGSGLIQYFYARALSAAQPGEVVDEADFRYKGQPPTSRETGIMMLADKVEAACRTLKDKSPQSIRALIQKLVNGAVTDGQLDHCPLTVKELFTIVDSFTNTLLGIYHHRIEYPGIPRRPPPQGEAPTSPIITLETPSPFAMGGAADAEAEGPGGSGTDPRVVDPAAADYESAEVHRPHQTDTE